MSHQIKTQLAQKLLTAAENSKNPKAVDLAFEVSKCFTVGFGVSEEVQSMELWLGIAADRGHLEAKFLCTMLGIPGKDAISPESSSPPEKQEPDTISLDLQTSYTTSKERYSRLVLDDIGDFEVYASDDAAAIRSMIHKRLSEGLNIQSFTGTIERSESYALSRAKFPLLHWAAFSGRIELVQVLISFGVNINSIDPRYYRTPLMIALDCAQTAVAELLLHEGADIYQSDRFGVVAPQLIPHIPPRKFSSMVQLFERASKGIQVGNERQRQCCADEDIFKNCEPPLLEAVHLSHPQAVTYVLDKTAHRLTAQEFSTALEAAATGLHANLCSIILAKAFQFCDSLPENPFRIIGSCTLYTNLLFHGRRWPEALEATVKVFLSHGIDINGCRDQDITVLGHAVLSNRPTVASVLKAHGASVEHITRDGLSVLDWAIISVEGTKNIGCVGWLLSCGVPLELLKGKCEPLHMACIHNAFGAAALLLEHQKTDINARSSNSIWDLTPLHSACLKNALETVQLLLSLGADATVVDSYKLTPLEQAVQLGRVEVVEFLLQNHVSIFNTHHVPPRSILAFYVSIREPVRSRTWLLLLDYVQSHAPEVLDGKFTRDRSLLMLATLAKNDHLIPGLIDARAEFTHPHLVGSEWVVMIADSHRIYDQEERGSQHLLEYRKALRAFVEVFEDQGLLLSLNDYGESLLFPAALCSNAVAVGVLLDAGSHRRVPSKFPQPRNEAIRVMGRSKTSKSTGYKCHPENALDRGASPDSESNGTPPLYLAVLASWHLRNTQIVYILCEHGAQSNPVASARRGVQPLRIALEPQTFIQVWSLDFNSLTEYISPDQLKDALEAEDLSVTRSLVQTLICARASFESLPDMRKKAIAEAIWKCSPLGLQAMLAEGVSLAKALGTGQAACHYTAQWIEWYNTSHRPSPRLVRSASVWLKSRLRSRAQNEQIICEHFGWTGSAVEIEELARSSVEGHDERSSRMNVGDL